LAEEGGDVGLDGEGFEIDDAEQELVAEDAELQGEAMEECGRFKHG
jgi:hypothetical protein